MRSTCSAFPLAEIEAPALAQTIVTTPIGTLVLKHRLDGALLAARFVDVGPDGPDVKRAGLSAGHPDLIARFQRYFAGELAALDDMAVAPVGSTFQHAVWAALRQIPAGDVRSYADIARQLGGAASGAGPNARAVGSANARNPVAIAVPCHRVIGADGRLTGYAAGLWRKAWLLAHEGYQPAQAALL